MDDVVIIRPSGKYVLLRLIMTIFVVESVYGLLFLAYFSLNPDQALTRPIMISLWIFHSIKFFILVALLTDIIIRYLSMHYYITRHHLIINRGIVNNEEKVYELQQVRKLSISQDYMGKKLNYGNVHLLLGARGFEENILLHDITSPREAVKAIEQYLGDTPTTTSH